MKTMFVKSARAPLIAAFSLVLLAGCDRGADVDLPVSQVSSVNTLPEQAVVPLPDLQLVGFDERPVSLSSYKGQPIVLNLWATWCPPCRREMPVLEQAQQAFPEIEFVLINQGETAEQAKSFLKSEDLALTDVLLDADSEAMKAMRTGGLPTTFFFDGEGRMVDLHLGEITMADLEQKISQHF
ncbi:TlpA family protein disulfide reductase [Yanghanlia caeni]|uniref:TlpA disulfide reductase family protein n=1 Tax=Yanghanlia caeni TaxID=3064283 RepID=A0ABU1D9S6_9BURK|nr:TlpA disulfide reductase family protein [Alcaligenaceae bacterium LG-2]